MSNPDGLGRDDLEPSVWRKLGIPDPLFEEGDGPPLSEEDARDVRGFVRNEPLHQEKERRVKDNLGRFRSWAKQAIHAELELRDETMEEGLPLSEEDMRSLKAYFREELSDDDDE